MKITKKRSFSIGSIFLLLFTSYSFLEPYLIEIKNFNVNDNGVPDSFKEVRIVFLTDLHHGPNFSLERLSRIVEKVNKLAPDIVLLGGDYVDTDKKYIEPCFNELKKLEAPMGVYAVLGNHDHWESETLTRKYMTEANITCLDNTSKWLYQRGEKIKIGGVGDLWEDKQEIAPTITDVKAQDFTILLSHNPDYVENLRKEELAKIDLVLSGHTHGGQVSLFGWSPIIPSRFGNKYRTGVVKKDTATVIISNGVGTLSAVIPPMRFFVRPQIYVINLTRK